MSKTLQSTAVTLTDSAVHRIIQLMKAENNPNAKLRISVEGGGCSGFQYNFEIDTKQNADDIIIEKDGATLLIDIISMEFLSGSVVDYVENLEAAHFVINNPSATASCGCGKSFAV